MSYLPDRTLSLGYAPCNPGNVAEFERFLRSYETEGIQLDYRTNGGSITVEAWGNPAQLRRFQQDASSKMLQLF